MIRRSFAAWSLLALVATSPAFGQYNQTSASTTNLGGSNSGLFGSSSLGGSFTGGNRTATGTGGAGALSGFGSDAGGLMTGNERFIRDARQAGTFVGMNGANGGNFVGNVNATGTGNGLGGTFGGGGLGGQRGLGQLGGGRLGGLGGLGNQLGLGNQFGNQQNQNQNRNQQQRQFIPTRLALGFEAPRPATGAISTKVTGKLNRLLNRAGQAEVAVEIADQTAILRGIVPTNHARELAERMAMMEPGIRDVRNELTVAAESPPQPNSPQPPAGS